MMKLTTIVFIFFMVRLGHQVTDVVDENIDPIPNVLIQKGSTIKIKEVPYMVLVRAVFRPDKKIVETYCGGSILSHRLILTAGHCIENDLGKAVEIFVQVGVNKTWQANTINVKKYYAVQYLTHPHFRKVPYHDFNTNDVAIIVLDRKNNLMREMNQALDKGYKAKAITITPPNRNYIGNLARLTGYGWLTVTTRPIDLRFVNLPVVTRKECKKILEREIDNSMLCAGYRYGLEGMLMGDSGSPLVIRDGGEVIQIGVASWRLTNISYTVTADLANEFTNAWIKKTIRKY